MDLELIIFFIYILIVKLSMCDLLDSLFSAVLDSKKKIFQTQKCSLYSHLLLLIVSFMNKILSLNIMYPDSYTKSNLMP